MARQLERPELLLSSINRLSAYGYNLCMLYLEDAYVYPNHETLGRPHAYGPDFMREVSTVCLKEGIELVPIIPALGHCSYITSKLGYEKYDEGFEYGEQYGTLVAGKEATYELMSELFKSWSDHFPGKYIHAGLDESPYMGLSYIRKYGKDNFDATAMFINHCNRLNAIVKNLGRRMVMWGDMFYYFPMAIDQLDQDIIVAEWYYYRFQNKPRVEAFNFAEIDLSGDLKKAGFEVWGIPSVWPNRPFPDIADRLGNLRSWQRYGRECGIDGIVNTDWENSMGFFSISELLFAVFGQMWPKFDEKLLPDALAKILKKMTGLKPDEEFILDLLALGCFHLTGHTNRALTAGSVMAMVSTAPSRITEFRQKTEKLREMFKGIAGMIKKCRLPEGENLLQSIRFCHQTLLTVWQTCLVMSDIYSGLRENRESLTEAGIRLNRMAEEIFSLNRDYRSFWMTVRFGDDDQKSISPWAIRTAKEIQDFVEKFNAGLPLSEHPMFMQPLLEMELECFHPALPVLDIEINWSDGETQTERKVMINFETGYAVPDKYWLQYESIPLGKNQLPETITFSSAHYGQVGIRQAKITWRGTEYKYVVYKTRGKNIVHSSEVLLLGPIGVSPQCSTHRMDCDKAYYNQQIKYL